MFNKTKLHTKWCRWLKKPIQLALLATLSSGNTYAEGDNDALTIRITNNYEMIWDNAGSNSPLAASFWQPIPDEGYYLVGHYFREGKSSPTTGSITVKDITSDASALTIPTSFTKEWEATDSEGGFQDVSLWKPNCQFGFSFIGYIALNDTYYPSSYYTEPGRTNVQNIRCVKDKYLPAAETDPELNEPELDKIDMTNIYPALISKGIAQGDSATYASQIANRINEYKKITAVYETQQKGTITATINNNAYAVQYATLTNSENSTRFTNDSGYYEFPTFVSTNIDNEYININLSLSQLSRGIYEVSIPETKIKWSESTFNSDINNLYKVAYVAMKDAYVAMKDAVFNTENISIHPFTIHFFDSVNPPHTNINDEIYVILNKDNGYNIYVNSQRIKEKNSNSLYASLIYLILTTNAALENPGNISDSSLRELSVQLESALDSKLLHVPDLYLHHRGRHHRGRHLGIEVPTFGGATLIFALYPVISPITDPINDAIEEEIRKEFNQTVNVIKNTFAKNESSFNSGDKNECDTHTIDFDISNTLLDKLQNTPTDKNSIQSALNNFSRSYCQLEDQNKTPLVEAWQALMISAQLSRRGDDNNTNEEFELCLIDEDGAADPQPDYKEKSATLLEVIGRSKDDTIDTVVQSLLTSSLSPLLSIPTKQYLTHGYNNLGEYNNLSRSVLFSLLLKKEDVAIRTINYAGALWGLEQASKGTDQSMEDFFTKLMQKEVNLQKLKLLGRNFNFKSFWGIRDLSNVIPTTDPSTQPIVQPYGLLDKKHENIVKVFDDEIERLAVQKAEIHSTEVDGGNVSMLQSSFNASRETLLTYNQATFHVFPNIYNINYSSIDYSYHIKLEYHNDLPVKSALIINHDTGKGVIKLSETITSKEKQAAIFEELGHLADVVTQGTEKQMFETDGDEGRAFLFDTLAMHIKRLKADNEDRLIPISIFTTGEFPSRKEPGHFVLWEEISGLSEEDLAEVAKVARQTESEDFKLIKQDGTRYTVEVQSSPNTLAQSYSGSLAPDQYVELESEDAKTSAHFALDSIVESSRRMLADTSHIPARRAIANNRLKARISNKSRFVRKQGLRLDLLLTGTTLAAMDPSILEIGSDSKIASEFSLIFSWYIWNSDDDSKTKFSLALRQGTILNRVFCKTADKDDEKVSLNVLHALETRYHFTSDYSFEGADAPATSSTIGVDVSLKIGQIIYPWIKNLLSRRRSNYVASEGVRENPPNSNKALAWLKSVKNSVTPASSTNFSASVGNQWKFEHATFFGASDLIALSLHLEYFALRKASDIVHEMGTNIETSSPNRSFVVASPAVINAIALQAVGYAAEALLPDGVITNNTYISILDTDFSPSLKGKHRLVPTLQGNLLFMPFNNNVDTTF